MRTSLGVGLLKMKQKHLVTIRKVLTQEIAMDNIKVIVVTEMENAQKKILKKLFN